MAKLPSTLFSDNCAPGPVLALKMKGEEIQKLRYGLWPRGFYRQNQPIGDIRRHLISVC